MGDRISRRFPVVTGWVCRHEKSQWNESWWLSRTIAKFPKLIMFKLIFIYICEMSGQRKIFKLMMKR